MELRRDRGREGDQDVPSHIPRAGAQSTVGPRVAPNAACCKEREEDTAMIDTCTISQEMRQAGATCEQADVCALMVRDIVPFARCNHLPLLETILQDSPTMRLKASGYTDRQVEAIETVNRRVVQALRDADPPVAGRIP